MTAAIRLSRDADAALILDVVEDAPIEGEAPQLTFRAIEGMEPPPLELAGAGADTE